jgi:uncharacterized protein YjbJ (UPF0337 family)
MDPNEIKGKWKQIVGAAKQKWGQLTDDDLKASEGNLERLGGKIQERYGLAKDKVKTELDALLNALLRKPEDKSKGAA